MKMTTGQAAAFAGISFAIMMALAAGYSASQAVKPPNTVLARAACVSVTVPLDPRTGLVSATATECRGVR
jgi:hypothetical protein